MRILSADFGTTSVKLSILDEQLAILRSHKQGYTYEVEGRSVQIDPDVVFRAFVDGIAVFGDSLRTIDVLCICALCPSLIAMDREGKPLHPAIIHLDKRSVAQARQALGRVGKDRFLAINGNLPFPGGISLTSILWLKRHRPSIYAETFRFGHMNTYLHRIFTDRFVIDPTNASFTGLYETLTWGGWSEEICSGLGIDRGKMPRIVGSDAVVGALTGRAARLTGLKSGTPVVMGSNDTSHAALGAGAVENGSILNVSGSNEIITITTDRPIPHEKVYLRTHAVRGRWLVLAITVGGLALEWFRREFYREMKKIEFYEQYLPGFVTGRFRKTDVRFFPHLAGDRHSISQKKGAFHGITLESTREDLLAALLTGIFEPIHLVLDIYGQKISLRKEVVLTGGMVNQAYLDFKRRQFGDFTFRRVNECSTLGNGKMALMALGI
jgi:sugar (pentulose or hexulose) kinase